MNKIKGIGNLKDEAVKITRKRMLQNMEESSNSRDFLSVTKMITDRPKEQSYKLLTNSRNFSAKRYESSRVSLNSRKYIMDDT